MTIAAAVVGRTLSERGVRQVFGVVGSGNFHVTNALGDAGACFVWANVLYLRPGTREHFLDNLARDWPELLPRYEALYAKRAYLGDAERRPIQPAVRSLAVQHGIDDRGPRPGPDHGATAEDGSPAPRSRAGNARAWGPEDAEPPSEITRQLAFAL